MLLFWPMNANNLQVAGAVLLAGFLAITAPASAKSVAHDLTKQIVCISSPIASFRAIEVGGVVVLRGRTGDRAAAEQAAASARSLGYTRIANLIQIEVAVDDARIERAAERQLALERGLDGTRIAVDSTNGVVRLTGTVTNELQKDMAASLVRSVDGVRSVQMALQR